MSLTAPVCQAVFGTQCKIAAVYCIAMLRCVCWCSPLEGDLLVFRAFVKYHVAKFCWCIVSRHSFT